MEQIAKKLGGPLLVQKGAKDGISDGSQTIYCEGNGSKRRAGGQVCPCCCPCCYLCCSALAAAMRHIRNLLCCTLQDHDFHHVSNLLYSMLGMFALSAQLQVAAWHALHL